MKIHIVPGRAEARNVSGAAVLIDIFRATSTIPVILLKGAEAVIPFPKIRDARRYARESGDVVTVGERYGIRIPGFNFNNSPSDIYAAELEGKKVAFTSTNGTRVLGLLQNASEIVTSSFINHTATAEWLSSREEIWIVRADRPDGRSQEDDIYADFLKRSLLGEEPDQDHYRELIRECNGSKTLGRLGYARDVEMALRIDLVDFPVFFRDGRFVRG